MTIKVTLGVSVVLRNHRPLYPDTIWSSSYHHAYHNHHHHHHHLCCGVYGAVLIFTGLRIRATLQRQNAQLAIYQNTPHTSTNLWNIRQSSTARRSNTLGSRRTLKILTFTSISYFTFWSPYVFIVIVQSFASSFKPPSGVEFTAMWLANTNSAVNVFIYSATNTQFRRQCVLLASRLCCSRLSMFSPIHIHDANNLWFTPHRTCFDDFTCLHCALFQIVRISRYVRRL